MLNVDFEWFDPQAEHDFHGIKSLLQQLFDIDAHLFELSALTDLILAQPLLGSTVKVGDDQTEANATDAYAFLSVVNLQEHQVWLRSFSAYTAATDHTLEQTFCSQNHRLPSAESGRQPLSLSTV